MKKRCLRFASVLTLGIFVLLIGGCGSSGNKEGDGGLTNVGDTVCTQCHSAVLDPLTQQSIIVQYERSSPHKDSPYANDGNGCEACHGSASQHNGIGPIQYPDPFAGNGTRCADCHKGDYATDAPTKFAGSNHGDPAKFTLEEADPCRRCHSHEGAVLSNIAGLTGNGEILDNPVNQGLVPFTTTYSAFRCSTCHEHGAGLRPVMARDNTGNLVNWNPDKNQEPGQFDLCTSCHTMYDYTGNTLLASGTAADAATGKPATGKVGHHETAWYRIIATTHYDNPATGRNAGDNADLAAGNVIEGYNLRKNTANPCFDCHGHEAYAGTRRGQTTTPTIYTDWAQSGHAGGLLGAKYAAADSETDRTLDEVDSVMISGVAATESSTVYGTLTRATSAGDAWGHYNWDRSGRAACQRCHTATGAANYLANPATYDANNNSFTHLSDWTSSTKAVGSTQNELLYCWGCHTNAAKGLLYAPGAITASYTDVSPEPVFPDSGASNICISCHSGRESGDSIKAKIGNFSNLSFINSHYLTAGGTVFAETGYEFAGRDYAIPSGDTHDRIGRGLTGNATVDADYTNGPCVSCHMDSRDTDDLTVKRSHTYSPLTRYADNDLALNPVCVNCHTTRGEGSNAAVAWLGDDNTAATLQGTTHRARYQAALEALKVLLGLKGYYFAESHPYFFTDNTYATAVKNWLSPGDADTTGATTGKNNMGAAFNYNLMKHDPGGVAHNRRYTRRLVYDAIDWVDDDTLNYSVSTTLNALDNATTYKASAISYLLQSSTGTSADRY